MTEIKKGHVVAWSATKSAQTGVVTWVGKDGRGVPHAVVRWDTGGLFLTPTAHLRVRIIALSAESRIEREPRKRTSVVRSQDTKAKEK